jgi:peptide methionine sulfoxide reductase MsrA
VFGAAAAAVAASLVPAAAEAQDDLVSIYFGVGCFWHVQHEFIEAEKSILGRGEREYTALAGYAGGTKLGADTTRPDLKPRLVCYHNLQGVADYGKLGHGEVVGMDVPASKVEDFAKVYFGLFDRGGDRPDKGDRGPEYRSLMGLPGGTSNPAYDKIQALASAAGLQLQAGSGDDGDTLGKRKVWVMDTATFPFHQGEVYHQYHDGFFPGEDYPASYNLLQVKFAQAGVLKTTGCPDVRI